MTNLERIIRRTLPGPQFAAKRREFRQLATDPNAIRRFHAYTGDDGIVSQAATAVITELERLGVERARAQATNAVIATGKCPDCGRPLRRNLSLTGWFQCSQFGAVTHRADPTQPACNWQAFQVEV